MIQEHDTVRSVLTENLDITKFVSSSATRVTMMNVIQSFPVKNAINYLPFSHPESMPRQQKFRVVSCKASNDFRKELSTLNSKCVNVDQIKKAYRKMVLRYHPDVCDPSMREESNRMFIEIQKAYRCLLDQESQKTVSSETGATKHKWESQLSELKRQSHWRQEQKEGSWGCRMRAKHHCP